MNDETFSRRRFVTGGVSLAGLAAAGCTTTNSPKPELAAAKKAESAFALAYGPRPKEQFPIPAVKRELFPSQWRRRRVDYKTRERPGTLIVDAPNFYLYHVEAGGTAMRYGVGLGRAGFEWSGRAKVAAKRKWPKWTPPDEMIAREPELEKWSWRNGGMPPGLKNPLGSRALYIFQGRVDTLYRLHGTPNIRSIGKAVSSGCVRLVNQDVMHLYERVQLGSNIVVKLR